MLESLVAGVLNRTLGSYVENFDPNQLNIGIWSGDVKLKNLKLKKESLDKLNLPIDLKCGNLGQLTLQIPWSNLKGQPVKVLIEDVHLLVLGRIPESINIEEDLQRELNAKKQRLESLEVLNAQKDQLNTEDDAKNQSFLESLTTKVIDNLQITIRNIHLRYEDKDAFSKYPYAVGATLKELSAVSTNGEWVPSFIEDVSSVSRKLMTLNSLTIYWDTDHSESIYDEDRNIVLERMQYIIDSNSNNSTTTEYILEPVSGEGRLTMNKLGAQENHPHYDLDLFFEQFKVELNKLQYRDILDTVARINWYQKTYKFKKFRPDVSVKEDPKKWLKYAFEAVYDEIHQNHYKKTWEYMANRRDQRNRYVQLWEKCIEDQNSLTPEEKSNVEELERVCDFEDLKFYRSLARARYKKSHPPSSRVNNENVKKGWFSWWGGGAAANNEGQVDDDLKITEEQKNEFYDAIEFDESKSLTDTLDIPRDRVKFAIGCSLNTGSFVIKPHLNANPIAEFVSNACHVDFFQRTDSYYIGFKLNEFKVEDGSESTLYKHIVSLKSLKNQIEGQLDEKTDQTNEPFFQVSYEQNPLDETADSELLAKLTSMTIFHNPKFLGSIAKFFQPPKAHEDTFGSLINAAESTLSDFTKMTRIGIQSAFESHKTINCKMDLQAPLIIVPVDAASWNSPVAILDAGHISILSDLVDKENIDKIRKEKKDNYTEKDWANIGKYMYDKFKLVLQDAQILIGPDIRSTIEQLHSTGDRPSLILDHLNMNFLIETSIIPALPEFPRVKVGGSIPQLKTMLNDYQYRIFMKLIDLDLMEIPDDDSLDLANSNLLNSKLASQNSVIYHIDDTSDDNESEISKSDLKEDSALDFQHQIELNFDIELIILSLKRCSHPTTYESDVLVDLVGENFKLNFFKTAKQMNLDLSLADVSIHDLIENSKVEEFKNLICRQPGQKGKDDLFIMKYTRSLRLVPFENEIIECYDQGIDINISDFQAVISRKSLLTLLNYSLNTFTDPMAPELPSDKLRHNEETEISTAPQHIDLNLKLKSFSLLLNDYGEKLATMTLEDAKASLFILPDSMKIKSTIGGFSLTDNFRETPQKLISIQGDDLCDLYYETFDPETNIKPYGSEFKFESKSMVIWFMEDSFNRLYSFVNQFQQMKYIYDQARDAALNQANIVEYPSTTKFEILTRAPIIVFPKVLDPTKNKFDTITVNLGEIRLENQFESIDGIVLNLMKAGLTNTKISSSFHLPDDSIQKLDIIDQLDIHFDIDSYEGKHLDRADIIAKGAVTGKEILLTEWQAFTIIQILKCFPRTFSAAKVDYSELEKLENDANDANMIIRNNVIDNNVKLRRERNDELEKKHKEEGEKEEGENGEPLRSDSSSHLDISFQIPLLSMTLFNDTKVADISSHKLTKFSLNDVGLSFLMARDGTYNSDMHIGSFVVDDLREQGKNKFTSIIPNTDFTDYQFMAKLESKILDGKMHTNVNLLVDSPKLLLAMDYLFALKTFADVATYEPIFPAEINADGSKHIDEMLEINEKSRSVSEEYLLSYNIKIYNPSITLLADSEKQDTEAIVFKIGELQLNSVETMNLNINEVGMFLCKMDSYDASKLRLLDDFSLTFNLDYRGCDENCYVTKISADVEQLLLRLSLRDIKLALEIFNRASDMYAEALKMVENNDHQLHLGNSLSEDIKKLSKYAPSVISSMTSGTRHINRSVNDPQLITKGERLNVSFQGCRLVLIGDIHELPILDFTVDPFNLKVSDWSTELSADIQLYSLVNIFNYSSSSWEPLVEKWPLNVHLERLADGKLVTNVVSREKTEIDITSRSIATLSHFATLLSENTDLIPRGEDSPYRIVNQTGFDMNIWIDKSGRLTENREQLTLLKDSESIPWSFEDWRQVRESLSLDNSTNLIAIELLDSNYDPICNISLKDEREEVFMLSPQAGEFHNRLACEIVLREDNVKQVIFKSTIDVNNMTPTSISIGMSNSKKEMSVDREVVIPPGGKCSLPIDYVYKGRFAVRPLIQSTVFGFSTAKIQGQSTNVDMDWAILKENDLFLECRNIEPEHSEGSYYFKAHAVYDEKEPLTRIFPHMTINITPPLIVENLLPFDIECYLFQKGERGESNVLARGQKIPLHLINMNKNAIMKIRALESKYELSQPAIVHAVSSLSNTDCEISLKSIEDGQRLNLGLRYVQDGRHGFKISIYTPYLIVNRTGQIVRVKNKTNTLISKPGNKTKPIPDMFSFSLNNSIGFFKGDLEKNRVSLSIFDSEASSEVSIDKIGQSFEVKMNSARPRDSNMAEAQPPAEFNIGVHISEGHGIYSITKVINIAPRYIIKNALDLPICVNQFGMQGSLTVKAGEIAPLYEMPKFDDKQLLLGYLDDQKHLSAPFSINQVGEHYIRVKRLDSEAHNLLRVVISNENASIYILVLDAKGLWPYSIRNFSDYEFFFYQANPYVDKQGNMLSDKKFTPVYYKIPPKSAMPYAWDFPAAEVKELVLRHGPHQRYVQIAEIGSLLPMKLDDVPSTIKSVDLSVIADGPVQSLVISNYDPKVSMYQLKKVGTSTSVAVKEEFQEQLKDEKYNTELILKFEGLGVSLINRKSEELCYITMNGAELKYSESDIYQNLNLKLKWLQIDNQLYPSFYPIILYPTVVPKSTIEMENHPVFSSAICRMKDNTHGVNYIKFATMLLQELSIEVDEDFLWALLEFSNIPGAAWNLNIEDSLWDESLEIPEPPTIRSTNDLYFEALNIQPLQFNLSFVRTEKTSPRDIIGQKNALYVVIDVLTMAIGNINEAPVKLSALFLENIRAPFSYLIRNVTEHYTQAFLYQFYKILGSADVFGNPVGLFNNISSGVMDIFYEPYQGYLMNEPQEVGYGIAKGGLSFLKKSIFGLSDSVSRFSGSMAKGLTAASLDKEFQERRRLKRQKNIPKHPMAGISNGATSLYDGITSGFTGLAMAPYEGASKEGTAGFIKGIGKGLWGLPTKTATGVFDFANNVSETIRNTTTVFDAGGLEKVRFPRYIPYDGSIVHYSEREARGLFWLKTCDGGIYADDRYLGHIVLQGSETACIVSMSRILIIQISSLTTNWQVSFEFISNITMEKTGIKIFEKGPDTQGKFIPISDKSERKFLYKNISIGVTAYNKKCIVAL